MSSSTVRLTILCDNAVARPLPLRAEHGFSCLVETVETSLLFDCGRSELLLHNAAVLKCSLDNISAIVLSHGHYDHGGGLLAVLEQVGPRPIYAHPEIFCRRYSVSAEGQRTISLPFTRDCVEAAGAAFRLTRESTTIAPGFHLSGEIPRVTDFEFGDARLRVALSATDDIQDPLHDDQSLIIDTPRGPVLLLGCAHAGLINILTYLRDRHGYDRWHAVVGGTHLGPVSEQQFRATLAALPEFSIEQLCLSHCTGLQRGARIYSAFPGKVLFAAVGFTLEC